MTINLAFKGRKTLFPVLPHVDLGSASQRVFGLLNRCPGFSENGDYVVLPNTSTGSLEYYDSSRVLQWSKAVTDVNAACDHWVGFCHSYNKATGLIYAVAIDLATSPSTIYTVSVNQAGTLVNIGNSQPATDLVVGSDSYWLKGSSAIADTSTYIQQHADLDIRMWASSAANNGLRRAIIDITTGAVGSPANFFSNSPAGSFNATYKTDISGVYIGRFEYSTTNEDSFHKVDVISPAKTVARLNIPVSLTNLPTNNSTGLHIIDWGDYVVAASTSVSLYYGSCIFLKTDFDAWIEECMRITGIL